MDNNNFRSIRYEYPNKNIEVFIQQKNIVGGWSTLFVGSALQCIKYCQNNNIICTVALQKTYPDSVEN